MTNTLRDYLRNERKEKLIRSWQYLKPYQKMHLVILASCWSLPTIVEIVRCIRTKFNNFVIQYLYKAHWLNSKKLGGGGG